MIEDQLEYALFMQIEQMPVDRAIGHLLVHNVVDAAGKRVLRKGVCLEEHHLAQLIKLGYQTVAVAVLAADDVPEDIAATQLAQALCTAQMEIRAGVGGRANLHTRVNGVVYIDAGRLEAFNSLSGVTLATLSQYAVVYPKDSPLRRGKDDQVATLKIIPYAIPGDVVAAGVRLATEAPILTLRPLLAHRVALLVTGDANAHPLLRAQFEPSTRQRVERLGSTLATVQTVVHEENAMSAALQALLPHHDALVIAGQTSIMDDDDLVLRSLRDCGAVLMVHGAPVDPGNLLAFAQIDRKPILCAPGCARSMLLNVVDLVLPRLLVGEQLTRADISRMGLGGLLRS